MNKFNYIIDTFKTIYDLGDLNPEISYGINPNSKIQITNLSANFFDSFENELNEEEIVFNDWKDQNIPFFFSRNQKKLAIEQLKNQVIINYDIIASSFLFLSGWLEYNNKTRDKFSRLQFQNTLQHKLDIAKIPVVDYYFDILKSAIEIAYNTRIKTKNGQHPFLTSVSHDIDKCQSGWAEEIFYLLKKFKFIPIIKVITSKIFNKDIWFNLSDILDYEKQKDIKSVFYFLTEKGKHQKGIYNSDYKIDHPSLKNIFNHILKNESEIGIHGSFGTSDSSFQFNKEISKLENIAKNRILGNRFHYLQYDINITPDILEKNHLVYDMSLGFAEHIGFRNGICHPFKLYNFKENKPYDYFEIPLVLMDVTLFNKAYMNLDTDEAFKQIAILISEIIKFKGVFTVLWHNNSYSQYKFAYRKKFFDKLVDYCKSKGSVFKTPKQILSV
jgi:peptidoglycan/xylan/chitin deacetylase (PgdA/CDA1 family)